MRAWRSVHPIICVAALAFGGAAAYRPPPASAADGRTYVVGRGDNLTVLARRFGTSIGALASANRLDPQRVLRVGTRLTIPVVRSDRRALVPTFQRWADANHLPVDLLMATTWLESGWQNGVVSPKGAVGIGQLLPTTAAFVRETLIGVPTLDERVPEHNIRMSARYLRWLLDNAGGDQARALAGYYQGPRSVQQRGLYAETFAYVRGVQALQRVFRAGRLPAPT